MNATAALSERFQDDELLGPDSLTWRFFGDLRSVLIGPRTGLMQNIHPAVGWGVWQHSELLSEPWDRLVRSLPRIAGVVFDDPADATPRWVLAQHPPIKGQDPYGRRYRALDPETFFWTHAMFVEHVITSTELFIRPLSLDEKERLWQEGRAWWRRYGMTERMVPDDYAGFQVYFERMVAAGEDNPGARAVLGVLDDPPPPPKVPAALWSLAKAVPLIGPANYRLLNIGPIHPTVRELLEIRWTRTDQLRFEALTHAVRRIGPLVPPHLRYGAFARAAYARHHVPLPR